MGIDYYDTRIYRYGNKYKVVYLNRFAQPELYVADDDIKPEEKPDGKLINNLCRAKSNVLALGMCNPWEYFVTLTLDKSKYDRSDLDGWRSDFTRWIRHQRERADTDIKYLLIPELHKDGQSWHMHGFLSGISWDGLQPFVKGVHPDTLVNARYRWHKGINDKFGFNSFGKLQNSEAASKYALKYISKSMAERVDAVGAHLYYCSRGLQRPELVADGCTSHILSAIEYKNEFMATGWLTQSQVDALKGVLM